MFAISAFEPQVVLSAVPAISSLASRTLTNGKSHSKQSKQNAQQTANMQVRQLLCDWGLTNLSKHVTMATLHPTLNPGGGRRIISALRPQTSDFTTSYVSSNSFFTNRHGFSFTELLARQPTKPMWFPLSVCQYRGFISSRETGSQGVGYTPPQRGKLLGLATKSKDEGVPIDKINTLLSEQDLPLELQKKVKIYAEGYLAGRDSSISGPVSKSRLKSFKGFIEVTLLVAFIYILYKLVTGDIHVGIMSKNSQVAMDVTERFDDVRGCDEVKEELEEVVNFLKHPDKFTALGAKLPKGVLLVGPPGCGKTLLARAVAGEAEVPFLYASGSSFDQMFVGVGAQRVRQLFDEAKMRAPCVIFLDEIDAVGGKRTNDQLHPYANQTINQLLTEMDGFEQNEGIMILAATNKLEHLDSALRRAGRFDLEINISLPDYTGRRDIFDVHLSKIVISSDVDTDLLARKTYGYSGADIANMVNQAAIQAALQGDSAIGMEHLEHVQEKITMGPMKKTRLPDEETNKVTAYHEAGHAIVAYYTKDAENPHKMTIMPRGQSLGHTAFVPTKDQYNMTRSQLLAELDASLGGRVAEEVIFGQDKITTGASSDFQKATAIAEAYVKRYGMSEKAGIRIIEDRSLRDGTEYSANTLETVDNEIKRLLQESYERCKSLLRSRSRELNDLSNAVLLHETLDRDQIKLVLSGKKLDKPASKKQKEKEIPNAFKQSIQTLIDITKLSTDGQDR